MVSRRRAWWVDACVVSFACWLLQGVSVDYSARFFHHAALSGDANAMAFRDQLERAVPAPKVPEWERIAQEMRIVAEQMVAGRLTVDAAAAELDRRTDAILAKRRWMLDQHEADAR